MQIIILLIWSRIFSRMLSNKFVNTTEVINVYEKQNSYKKLTCEPEDGGIVQLFALCL
jgi:hypothetical protein